MINPNAPFFKIREVFLVNGLNRGPVTKALQSAFFDVVAGREPKYESWLRYL